MKKKLISSLLAVTLVAGSVSAGLVASTERAHAASFSDIDAHWAKSYILKAADAGIITGYPDGTFLPDKPVKRSEFTKMINNTLGNTATADISFKDVPAHEWYYNDVAKALAAGYVGGYDTGDFKPDNYISRQEAAVMLSRIVPTADYSANLNSYKDYANVSDWAQSSLSRIVGKKYIGAYDDGLLHPLDNLTRAQAAKILYEISTKESIVKSSLTVRDADTELKNKIYSNGITLNKDIGDGEILIDNCVVLGSLYVQGGGSDDEYVTIVDSRVADMQISKSASAVKVLAKDDTRILKTALWKDALLETSSLDGGLFGTGFDTIELYGNTTATLDGNFPAVDIKGSAATLNFDAGTITTLTVDAAGKNSEVVSGEYATITTANVNGATEFKGEGQVTTLNANASGVTYETKPKTINTKSGVSAPTYSDAAVSISVTPKNADTDISVDTEIVLSFSTAIKKYNGNAIANNSDIKDIVELRKGSESGTKIAYTGSINSAKKVITINPDSNLDYNTKYYIVIPKNEMKDASGNANAKFVSYFTTADNAYKISNITATSNENSITASVTATQDGKVWAVLLPNGAKAPTAAQIKAGHDGNNTAAIKNYGSITVKKNTAVTLATVTGLDDSTKYVLYCVLESGTTLSPVASKEISTTAPSIPDATLTSLAITGASKMTPAFSPTVTEYDVEVPFNSTSVVIEAAAPSGAAILYSRDGGLGSSTLADNTLDGTKINKFYIKTFADNHGSVTYLLNVEVQGNTGVGSVAVDNSTAISNGSSYVVPHGTASANITITSSDSNATITCNQLTGTKSATGTLSGEVTLDASAEETTVSYTIKSNLDEQTYTFKILIAADPTAPTPPTPSGGGVTTIPSGVVY